MIFQSQLENEFISVKFIMTLDCLYEEYTSSNVSLLEVKLFVYAFLLLND